MNVQRKRVVYTAVFGGYDRLAPVAFHSDCDFVCFTDEIGLVVPGWRVIHVSPEESGLPTASLNRIYKMLPHRFLADYDQSLYVDGNIRLVADPSRLFDKYLAGRAIAIPRHRERDCIYAEADFCVKIGLCHREEIERQLRVYRADQFPPRLGLTENSIILRDHRASELAALMEDWWRAYCEGAKRDQLSLPYLAWKHGIAIADIAEGVRVDDSVFKIGFHCKDENLPWVSKLGLYLRSQRHLRWYYELACRALDAFIALSGRRSRRG